MAGLSIPQHLQGTSLTPLLSDPDSAWKNAAFSQFLLGRFGPPVTRQQERMGYAIRTDNYRYVEWYAWNKETKSRGELLARELFDHQSDPHENQNLAHNTTQKSTMEQLSRQLNQGWRFTKPKTP
ncbi:MAG: DUF4976 domain-containing protein [Anaerolineales bacterium]|nr:DUF4976 domain-containing protein [Anaerolineales bacterium]